MKIELNEISIKDLFDGYIDEGENGGVRAFHGKLNVRPPYQREFVYKDAQRNSVIQSVMANFPLNVMYWVEMVNENGDVSYELLDGQQRTVSICQYLNGDFSINEREFHNLESDEQEQILNYKLQIYICKNGTDSEILNWFQVINIAGEKLTDQELRNAVYRGPWVLDAKKYFSKTSGIAYQIASKYLTGSPIRQEYLETAIKWFVDGKQDDKAICQYMAKHQHEQNANELKLYFSAVIDWINLTFPHYRKEMKSVNWGYLYNYAKDKHFNTEELEIKIKQLMLDKDVTKKSGIYEYLITGNERSLSIRAFDEADKREAYEKQNGICPKCQKHFEFEQMAGDHIIPWSKGGKTIPENCQMLCSKCNAIKSNN